MKKKNCRCEFSSERSEFLLRNFRESIAAQSQISLKRAFQDAADAPAPRFWVSEARAARVVGLLLKGIDATEGMHPEKRRMYLEIYRRFLDLRKEQPESCIGDLVFQIVNSEAPCSYLSSEWAGRIINESKKLSAESKKKRI